MADLWDIEFGKGIGVCAVRVVAADTTQKGVVSSPKYSIFISNKTYGMIYGHSYTNEQLVCRIKAFKAPVSVFNPDMPSIYKIVFNNHIEELEARFSLRRQ